MCRVAGQEPSLAFISCFLIQGKIPTKPMQSEVQRGRRKASHGNYTAVVGQKDHPKLMCWKAVVRNFTDDSRKIQERPGPFSVPSVSLSQRRGTLTTGETIKISQSYYTNCVMRFPVLWLTGLSPSSWQVMS